MKIKFQTILILIQVIFAFAAQAQVDSNNLAHVIRQQGEELILGLSIVSNELVVEMVNHQSKIRPRVNLKFKYDRKDWQLYLQDQLLLEPNDKDGIITIPAFLNEKINEVSLFARGPHGALQVEKIYIYAPEAREFEITEPWNVIHLEAGLMFLSYKQQYYNEFKMFNTVIGAHVGTPDYKDRWSFKFDLNVAALNIQSNQEQYAPQLFQFNVTTNYKFQFETLLNQNFYAQLGVNYFTMIANGTPFGVKDLIAPLVGLTYRKIIDRKNDWILFFHLIPYDSKLNLNSSQVIGLSKGQILENRHHLEFSYELQKLNLNTNVSSTVELNTQLLKIGYSF